MIELMKAIGVLREYANNQARIHEEYGINNEEYLNGLDDAVRILQKIRDHEIDVESRYYDEAFEKQTSDGDGQ